jgi:glycosyltransferase involved in cell wall biosynthesis
MSAACRVSIGMPAYNRGSTITRAIESVLAQTFGDFELIVSDNASTDETEDVCRRYAARDARIRYTRHPGPIGGFPNFQFVLDAARAPYFMWLPPDDYALPRLLERAVAVLDTHADVVCCVPQIEFLGDDGRRWPAEGTFPLVGTLAENLWRFLYDPRDNSRFYGLYRRDVLRRVLPPSGYHAFDWTISVGTLMAGKHWELDEILLVREASDPTRYTKMIDQAFGNRLARLVPLLPFTRAALFELRVPPRPSTLARLFRLNLVYHVMYCQYRYPRYGQFAYTVAANADRAMGALWRGLRGARGARTA